MGGEEGEKEGEEGIVGSKPGGAGGSVRMKNTEWEGVGLSWKGAEGVRSGVV